MATVAVIVASWNTRELLAECLTSVDETTAGTDVETVVVDNASSDGSPAMVRERFPSVHLIANRENVGFARANNQAMASTAAPYVLMLNSDARLGPGSLQRLLERMAAEPRAGLVGAQLRFPDGTFQLSHVRFPSLGREALILSGLGRVLYGPWYPSFGPDDGPRVVDWVGGACMLARRTALDVVAGFDEDYFLYGEEMDLCYRLHRAGWEVWYEPTARVIHHGGASLARMHGEERLYRGRMQFFRTHYGARSARLLAAELQLFTPPKIALHAALRALSRGRIGRQIISLRSLRAAVQAPDAAPSVSRARPTLGTSQEGHGAAGPAARTLVVATAARRAAPVGDAPGERFPRQDYVELCGRIGADLLDYGVYPGGPAGRGLRRLETHLRSDPYLAWHALRRARRYARLLCMSERAGIPLAALRRAGLCNAPLAVLFQAWSDRQQAAVTRLGLFGAIDLIGVNCTAMRDHFIALGAAPEKVHVLRWSVDHTFFTPGPDGGGGPFALALGEARGRDYPLLLAAVDGLPIELRVLPGGYSGAREKEPATFARVPANVAILPLVPIQQLRDLYAQARFVVLPVLDVLHPAGITATLEAMCMARAVIAIRSRGLRDYLVDGETCLLVEPGDVAGMRAAIHRLATDPQLARRLGDNGRAHVEAGLNQQRYVEQLAALVRDWAAA